MEAVSKLRNLPISSRKVQLVADLIRGKSATQGLAILKHTPKKCAIHLEKLLLSAVASWEHKNEGTTLEEASLFVEAIWVNRAGMLKRLRPAPQGRAHRIRKRISHVTLVVNNKDKKSSSVAPEAVGKSAKAQQNKDSNGTKS